MLSVPMMLKLLSVMYINQTLKVEWKSKTCDEISDFNGVNPGGLLSPKP